MVHVECLQTAEARDAVVDVDHVIARQIAEIGKKGSRFRLAPALFTALCTLCAGGLSFDHIRGFVEDVCFDVYDQVRLRQFKSAAETTDSYDNRAVVAASDASLVNVRRVSMLYSLRISTIRSATPRLGITNSVVFSSSTERFTSAARSEIRP